MGRHIYVTSSPGQMVQNFRSVVRILVGGCRQRRRHIGRTGVRTADQKVCGRLHYHSATTYCETSRSPHCLDPCPPLTKDPKCVFPSD